jgi:predicted transcriptional regulator
MGKGRHAIASHERRVRRVAVRYGLNLMKAQKPFGKVLEHGGYMLRDDDTRKIVFGDKGYEFSATLDEVEDFLLAQPKHREDKG